jgi:hypothetical protein
LNESDLSRKLVKALRTVLEPEGFVIFKHNQRTGVGVPDISVTGKGSTSWWEVKHLRGGRLIQRGVQSFMMGKLGHAGEARYIMFYDDHTTITDGDQNELISWPKFADIEMIVDYVRWVHTRP